jgi:ATP/maltotriose-dependent transcriptional regulator MalT
MSRRRHAQLHLPSLSPRDALTVVAVLKRAIAAIERAHGENMRAHLQMRQREARARRHGVTIYNLDVDPDADF